MVQAGVLRIDDSFRWSNIYNPNDSREIDVCAETLLGGYSGRPHGEWESMKGWPRAGNARMYQTRSVSPRYTDAINMRNHPGILSEMYKDNAGSSIRIIRIGP